MLGWKGDQLSMLDVREAACCANLVGHAADQQHEQQPQALRQCATVLLIEGGSGSFL